MKRLITISGWPGAGSSTLCMVLAKTLEMKLVQGSETFRLIGKELKYANTGQDRIEADILLENDFGHLYDKYIDHLIINGNNLVIESDIAAFRLGKRDDYFSIFLAPSLEHRQDRLRVDGREADVEVLTEREKTLAHLYKELHNIDWLSLDEIEAKHNLVMDTSNMSIAEELRKVYEEVLKLGYITAEQFKMLDNSALETDRFYWENGKEWFLTFLKNAKLFMSAEEVLKDINLTFSEEVANLPQVLKEIISRYE